MYLMQFIIKLKFVMSMSWTENLFILGKGHYFLEEWVGQFPISLQQELLKKDRATKAMGKNAIQVLLFDLKKLFNKLLSPEKSYKNCAKKVRKKIHVPENSPVLSSNSPQIV